VKTILIADDNKNIREYCRAAFEEEGYRVVLARDGIEALRVFCAEAPDLAILDISMPQAGGLDALEQIRRLAPKIPAILYTAHDEDCLRDRRAALATACVEKSSDDLRDLKRTVAHALQSSHDETQGASLRQGLPPWPAKAECS
jgi:CheY-like chemotaxis protein